MICDTNQFYWFKSDAIFSANATKASPSGLVERAAGSPESPPSLMLWTIGICPNRETKLISHPPDIIKC